MRVSDVAISNLEFIEPEPFCTSKFSGNKKCYKYPFNFPTKCIFFFLGLTSNALLQLARLSGLTNEISFPLYDLNEEEEMILNSNARKKSRGSEEMVHSNSDSQVNSKTAQDKPALPRTVESLTNEIVSNILEEVTKMASSQSETILRGEQNCDVIKRQQDTSAEAALLQKRFALIEEKFLKLAFLQFAALKTLGTFVMTSQFTELFLINDQKSSVESDCIREIMYSIVDKSVDQCKLKNIVTVADTERAMTVLHMNHTKNKGKCDLENCGNNFSEGTSSQAENTSFSCSSATTLINEPGCSSSSQEFAPKRSPKHQRLLLRPPSSLTVQGSSPFSCSRTVSLGSSPSTANPSRHHIFTSSESEDNVWHVRRRSSSPPPPPITAPLLEMGFPLKHILKALHETKSSGEVSARTINMLATWMCEHPYMETRLEQNPSGNLTSFRELWNTSTDLVDRQNVIIER